MPPLPARNFFVVLFDMKTKSRVSALKALSTILLYKRQSKDQYKLYLVNTAKSSSQLPEGLFCMDANTGLETIFTELQAIETGKCDWLDALNVAVDGLKEWYQTPGIISLQVLFITDLSSFERPNNGKLLEKITTDLYEYDIFLYVVGPDLEPTTGIFSQEDVEEWMQNLRVDKDNSNLKIMKKIINKTPHSVMCSYDVGVHLFNSYQYRKGMQPWQVPLTFGTIFELAVTTIRITKKNPRFKLTKTKLRSRDGRRWVYKEEEDVDYLDQAVPGVIKHGKFVKIETNGMFKIDGLRSFRVLGFTSAENVPEYFLRSDGSYLVLPKQNQPEEQSEFFSALVDELEETNKYIIARRVYNKGSKPKFVVLMPNSDFGVKCFNMCELPYADDIVHNYVEQEVEKAPKVEKNEDIVAFLDSLDVSGENCKIKVSLGPAMMVATNSLNFIKKIEEKTGIEEQFFERKFDISNADVQNLGEDLKNAWPVRELSKAKKEEAAADGFDDISDFNFD